MPKTRELWVSFQSPGCFFDFGSRGVRPHGVDAFGSPQEAVAPHEVVVAPHEVVAQHLMNLLCLARIHAKKSTHCKKHMLSHTHCDFRLLARPVRIVGRRVLRAARSFFFSFLSFLFFPAGTSSTSLWRIFAGLSGPAVCGPGQVMQCPHAVIEHCFVCFHLHRCEQPVVHTDRGRGSRGTAGQPDYCSLCLLWTKCKAAAPSAHAVSGPPPSLDRKVLVGYLILSPQAGDLVVSAPGRP